MSSAVDPLMIARADPGDRTILPLIGAHLAHSRATTPEESIHALDVTALQSPDIRF